ncbi:CPBP family intramembrane metalloprotease [Streptosporangium oxazolinicum]|uniref:CPBP family intramembrane metalloprotease n=1 Tax=Streptosporangium oxazolinicum TaxID=909287 RepID=A0ABP8AWK1_9ACTN
MNDHTKTSEPPANALVGDAAGDPEPRGPRAVPPDVEYHRVLAGEKRRIGRGILAIALLLGGMLVFAILLGGAAALLDAQWGDTTPAAGGIEYTPLQFAAGMASIALLAPWSMLIQRWLYGVRGPSLHSVISRFRFDLFGRALVLVGPLWVLAVVTQHVLLGPDASTEWSFTDVIGILAAVLLLTPLQAAGEEYGLRGLVFRVAGSWARGPRAGLIVGIIVSSVAFAVIHAAADPWLNAHYLMVAVILAIVTWRTGGLEIAVVVHALNNMILFLFVVAMHGDIGAGLTDRSAGVASAAMVVPLMVAGALVVAVVWLRTRHTGPARTPADQLR